MSLIATIKADQLAARKARNQITSSLLTTLIGEATTVAKNAGRELPSDDEVTAIIRKFLKGNAEVQAHLTDDADVAVAKTEAAILSGYLPTQLSEDQLREVVKAIVAGGAANVGAVMGQLKAKHAGLYDGKMASTIVKELLG